MSNFTRILVGLALGLVILVAISYCLPTTIKLAREIEIEASEDRLYPRIADLNEFNKWSPWAAMDPNTRYAFSGPRSGKGAEMAWQSDNPHVGSGTMKIVEAEPHKRIDIELDMGEHGQAVTQFQLAPVRAGTRVTWRFQSTHSGSPIERWFGLFLEGAIGEKYEEGLQKLKWLAEKN